MSPRRRGPGEGTVRERPDGLFEARLPPDWSADGRRHSLYAPTRTEAIRNLDAARRDAARGLPPTDARLTVGAFLARWLETIAPRIRPLTLQRYRQLVRYQLTPSLGRRRLAQLTPDHVAAMLAQLQADGLSPRTAAHARAVLRDALADAMRWGHVARNVAQLADAPRVAPPEPRILTPAEVEAVLAACTDAGLRRLATAAVHTGLRQAEELGLTWGDIDLDGAELHVRHALQRVGGAYSLVEPKSRTSRRAVPLTPAAVAALREEGQAQRLAQLAAGRRWRPPIADLVYTTRFGQPRHGAAVTHSFQGALTAAGLPVMRWHDLRGGYAGLLLAGGTDLGAVSALLGHSSVALTAATYAGVAPSLKRAAVDRLARLLTPDA